MANFNPNTTPALEPPLGVTPNLINPYTRQPYLIGTSAVCVTFTTICIIIRTFTKAHLFKKLGLEDYSLIFAGLGFAAFCGVMLAAGNAGQGRHQWDVSVTGLLKVVVLSNILEILYGPVMYAAKASVLLQMMRIFTGNTKNFVYWSFITLIALNGFFYLGIFISFLAACVPRAKLTDPSLPGTCISTNGSILATSVCNIISDFSILILPMIVVWSLRIPLKMKLTVGAVFGTGLFACVSSILRLVYSIQLTLTNDVTYAISPVGLWALAEFTTVIMAGCFPVFPRFFKFLSGKEKTKAYVNSYGVHSKHVTPKRSDHVYTETAVSATPWGGSEERIVRHRDYVELDDRKQPDNDMSWLTIPTSKESPPIRDTRTVSHSGIIKTVSIEATSFDPKDAV